MHKCVVCQSSTREHDVYYHVCGDCLFSVMILVRRLAVQKKGVMTDDFDALIKLARKIRSALDEPIEV